MLLRNSPEPVHWYNPVYLVQSRSHILIGFTVSCINLIRNELFNNQSQKIRDHWFNYWFQVTVPCQKRWTTTKAPNGPRQV